MVESAKLKGKKRVDQTNLSYSSNPLSSCSTADIPSEAASLSGLHHDNDTEWGTSSPALASVESAQRKRKAGNSDEHVNSAMLQYLGSQRKLPKLSLPPSVIINWEGFDPSNQLEKLDDISWLNFITDSQRLLFNKI